MSKLNACATPNDRISLRRLRRNGLRAIRYRDDDGVRHGWVVSEHKNETLVQFFGDERMTHIRGDDRRYIQDYVPMTSMSVRDIYGKKPVMWNGAPLTEADVDDFIRERTKIYRNSWILNDLRAALAMLDEERLKQKIRRGRR